MTCVLLAPVLVSGQTSTALSSTSDQRGFMQVGGGAQSGSHTLNSTSTFSIYDETATIAGTQEFGGGAILNVATSAAGIGRGRFVN